MNRYRAGQVVELTATFTRKSDGAVGDPSTVAFVHQPPGGTKTTVTYAGASVPAVGTVAKLSTGVYQLWVDTTGTAGLWTWEAEGTGGYQAAGAGAFQVAALPL